MRMRAGLALLLVCGANGLSTPMAYARRSACQLAAAAVLASPALSALADDADPQLVSLYFGAGCFWHVQHEMVTHERTELKRKGAELTAVTGYAGGTRKDPQGLVCYHNPQGIADYSRLGHTEVVKVTVPVEAVPSFAKKYIALFGSQGIRHDPQDKGGEYRSAIGLPGGTASPMYESIAEAASASPMRLVAGKGDEGDTLGDRTIYVYDSQTFPFYLAELYHQFHDDMGQKYGTKYNNNLQTLYQAKRIGTTGCPDII